MTNMDASGSAGPLTTPTFNDGEGQTKWVRQGNSRGRPDLVRPLRSVPPFHPESRLAGGRPWVNRSRTLGRGTWDVCPQRR